jgi:erythromycin esterase
MLHDRVKCTAILLVALAAASAVAWSAQADKEAPTQAGLPPGWFGGSQNVLGYEAGIDRKVFKEGKIAAYVRMKDSKAGQFGTLGQSFLAKPYHGKRVRLSAQFKTKDVKGNTGLWMRVDGKGKMLGFDNMADRRLSGTKDWTKAEIVLDISPKATAIFIGMLLVGDGHVWVDDFKVEVVGKDVKPTAKAEEQDSDSTGDTDGIPEKPTNLGFEMLALPVKAVLLNKEETAWLKENAIPFATEKAGKGFADLKAFGDIVGDARIVSLGEGTHGTSEFFAMKHRLTEYLASTKGFTYFAIEANMPEAYRVNEYVLRGKGDPRKLLEGMYFWTWNTQEVLDMIEWMRRFNAAGKGKIQFLGFDMQFGKVALANVAAFAKKADPEYAKTLDAAYEGLADYWGEGKGARAAHKRSLKEKVAIARRAWAVVKHLEANRDKYRKSHDADTVERAIQDARVAAQSAQVQYRSGEYRDECMAENVAWILGRAPKGAKIVLWAHNGHVARQPGAMGSFLAKRFGKEMVVLGFACREGKYTAIRPGAGLVDDNPLQIPQPGAIEWHLHQTGHARCVLDLRKAVKADAGKWLDQPLPFRSIGALAMTQQFFPFKVTAQYDALIYFDRTKPSACFPVKKAK